ncbi:MAG: DNA mismatch repair protein MutS [Lachnospiraceae bacterium]|nr:DNA mismatch repair protein MutS [Lachnospiraceae bacterium]
MLSFVKGNMDLIEDLYNELGTVEFYLDIAMYRASIDSFAEPQFAGELSLKNAYHPLINDPVKNSINVNRGVLLTGSNASGKSTFLKTVAINILFAQTIYTVLCDSYSGELYSLFSSMSLRDNLEGDSYFMVEIKAIKRILDFASANSDKKIVCFVDEVLRGTNTVERISASTEILRHFADLGVLCFAATHDGELTFLLEDRFDNYHFEEEILDNDVLFNYKLNSGRATGRNAIKLLSVMGFEETIVDNASKRAEAFLEKGLWEA